MPARYAGLETREPVWEKLALLKHQSPKRKEAETASGMGQADFASGESRGWMESAKGGPVKG